MKNHRSALKTTTRALITLLCAATFAAQASEPLMNRFWLPCDVEWDRIKSLPPLSKTEYEKWLIRNPSYGVRGDPQEGEADYYYFMARIPFVIGQENTPSVEQRDQWLQKAAVLGHKAAKAALMRLRYLGPEDSERLRKGDYPKPLENPRATRTEYLLAAREAAEAGDPEFATVMMDTALNINRRMHCQDADTTKAVPDINRKRCDPQEVTKESETKKWAEIAARGGNPNAKELLCTSRIAWPHKDLGFTYNAEETFAWCFAAEHTACLMGASHLHLESLYERGVGTAKNLEKAEYYRKLHPRPINAHKALSFPITTR